MENKPSKISQSPQIVFEPFSNIDEALDVFVEDEFGTVFTTMVQKITKHKKIDNYDTQQNTLEYAVDCIHFMKRHKLT